MMYSSFGFINVFIAHQHALHAQRDIIVITPGPLDILGHPRTVPVHYTFGRREECSPVYACNPTQNRDKNSVILHYC